MNRVKPKHLQLTFDRGTLLLRGSECRQGWTFDPRVGCLRNGAIHYANARSELRLEFNLQFQDSVRVAARIHWPKVERAAAKAINYLGYSRSLSD